MDQAVHEMWAEGVCGASHCPFLLVPGWLAFLCQCLSSDMIAFFSPSVDGAIVKADTFPSCIRRVIRVKSGQMGRDGTF